MTFTHTKTTTASSDSNTTTIINTSSSLKVSHPSANSNTSF